MIHFGIPSIYVGSRAGFVEPRGAATSLSLIHPEAIYDIDFANGQWFGALPSDLVVSRASEALTLTAGDTYANFASNTARITANGLLIEEARTNSIRNSRGSGAAAGVVGSGGAVPTNWGGNQAGLTLTISTGSENGLPYVDFAYSGTATSTQVITVFDTTTGIAAASGQTWLLGAFISRPAAALPPINTFLRHSMRAAAGAFSSQNDGSNLTLTTSLAPYSYSSTLGDAATQFVQFAIVSNVTSGNSYDFTIRIAAPLARQASFAGSPILNAAGVTSSATTQPADVVYLPISGVGTEYTIYAQTAVLAGHVSSGALIEAWASSSDRIRPNISQTTQGGSVTSGGSSRSIAAFTAGSGAARKVAMRVQGGNIIVACNGSLGTADTGAAPVVAPSRLYFGSGAGGTAAFLNDELLRGAIIPRALTDSELQALTSG